MNINSTDVINMDMNNMCDICKNTRCENNTLGVRNIISYVKNTEKHIYELERQIKMLKNELIITNEQYDQRKYALLAQKELLREIYLKRINIDYNWRERGCYEKFSNMLDEIECDVDEELKRLVKEDI